MRHLCRSPHRREAQAAINKPPSSKQTCKGQLTSLTKRSQCKSACSGKGRASRRSLGASVGMAYACTASLVMAACSELTWACFATHLKPRTQGERAFVRWIRRSDRNPSTESCRKSSTSDCVACVQLNECDSHHMLKRAQQRMYVDNVLAARRPATRMTCSAGYRDCVAATCRADAFPKDCTTSRHNAEALACREASRSSED